MQRTLRDQTRNKWVRPNRFSLPLAMGHVVTFMCGGYFGKGHLLVIFLFFLSLHIRNQHAASLPNTERGQIQLALGRMVFLMNPPTKESRH